MNSVAILDIRSFEVTAVIAEEGINNTYVFKGSQTVSYEGYEDGSFYDTESLNKAIVQALSNAEQSANQHITQLFVGVPGDFLKICTQKSFIGFSYKKKIASSDIQNLYKTGLSEIKKGDFTFLTSAPMYFVTGDGRKVSQAVGFLSSSLQGFISYIFANNYFIETVEKIINEYGIKKVEYLATPYVEGMYLLEKSIRNDYAILLDIGKISSTISIFYGNGILRQQSFWFGEGQLAAYISQDFALSLEQSEKLLSNVNLFTKNAENSSYKISSGEDELSLPMFSVNDRIKFVLDNLCEPLGKFIEDCQLGMRPIYLTGEGLTSIRGVAEHISKRLNREIEIIMPELPYYNQPGMSSRISLLAEAFKKAEQKSFLYKLFNGFGG